MKKSSLNILFTVMMLVHVLAIRGQDIASLPFAAQHALKQVLKSQFRTDSVVLYQPFLEMPSHYYSQWKKAISELDVEYNPMYFWDANGDGIQDYTVTIAYGKRVKHQPTSSACIILESSEGSGFRAIVNPSFISDNASWPPFFVKRDVNNMAIYVRLTESCKVAYTIASVALTNGFVYKQNKTNQDRKIDRIEYSTSSVWPATDKAELIIQNSQPFVVKALKVSNDLTLRPDQKVRYDTIPFSMKQKISRETLLAILPHLTISGNTECSTRCIKDGSSLLLTIQYANGSAATITGNNFYSNPTLASCVLLLEYIKSASVDEQAYFKTMPGNFPIP